MKRSIAYLGILSFFLIIIFLGTFKIVDFDFGWHLKSGKIIYSTKSIPTKDIFSYVAEGNKWVDSHWLFQLILYIFYAAGGINGCIILRILVLMITFGFVFFTIYRKEYLPISLILCTFALFISLQRFIMRPEIFSFLFLALFFYCMERFSQHPHLSIIATPLCQIMWTNMHGVYMIGILFLLLYLSGDLLQQGINKYFPIFPEVEIKTEEWKQRGILLGLTCMGLLLNANGKDGILYPFKIFYELRKKPSIFPKIVELVSPFSAQFSIKNVPFPDPTIVYKIFILISLISIICQFRHIRLAHILPYGVFLYLSLLAVRNMPLFAIVAVPITIKNCYGILDFLRIKMRNLPKLRFPVAPLITVCFIGFAAFVCFVASNNTLYQRLHYLRSFGMGESDSFPAEAVEFIKTKNIPGNIFNSSEIGGYLIWKLYPQKKVALDGRWEVYGDFLENIQEFKNPFYFARLALQYNIQALILHKKSLELQLMWPWLQMSRLWRLAKETQNALVYEKSPY